MTERFSQTSAVTETQQKQLEWIIERFEQAWFRGDRPMIDTYLPADPFLRKVVIVELVHIDLEFRRKAGEAVDVAWYHSRFPEIQGDSELMKSQSTLRDPPRPEKPAPQAEPAQAPGRKTATWLSIMPGTVIGGYKVGEMLGAGGMGIVFKAQHLHMKRTVALKMLRPSVLLVPELVKRFYREIEVMAKLSHSNIVAALDAGQFEDEHYLVMEFVEGVDLARFKTHGALSVDQCVNWVLQIASGLEYVHRRGVVHRDVKPANLMLDKQGTIKILDLGLAGIRRGINTATLAGQFSDLTDAGSVVGTVDFMSPEQSVDSHDADATSDVYSLGATLYYLLTGMPMYCGRTNLARIVAHREAAIPSLCAVRPDVPPQIDTIFRKMDGKKKADRYPTMTKLIAELRQWRATAGTS